VYELQLIATASFKGLRNWVLARGRGNTVSAAPLATTVTEEACLQKGKWDMTLWTHPGVADVELLVY